MNQLDSLWKPVDFPAPEQGPSVVAIGGGNGLSTMLRGLKSYTKHITAIVTVADDGGSSGMLRQELGMPAPGDIRNCMQALSNVEPLMEQLLAYRFQSGSLTGQSFGNLILAALNGIFPSFDQAVAGMQQVLAITGRVLPVTTSNVQLEAVFENGARVLGESKISAFKKEQDCRITRIHLLPEHVPALQDAIDAILRADLILLGPGSLYSSVIPNLLVDGIADALHRSKALRMYLCNIMTQDGETEGYTASDHISALYAHGGTGFLDVCLCNCAPISPDLLERYRVMDSEPVRIDAEALSAFGVDLVARPLWERNADQICHAPLLLTHAIQEIYEARTIKVFPSEAGARYVWET